VEKTEGKSSTVYVYLGSMIVYEKNLVTGVATKHFYADGMQIAKTVGNAPDLLPCG
jgi:hypothetical protein